MPDVVSAVVLAHAATGAENWLVPLLVGGVPALGYLWAVTTLTHRVRAGWSRWRCVSFLVGCVVMGAGVSPVVERMATSGQVGHMVQHLLLGMYAPVLLVLGAPVTALLGASSVPARRRIRSLLAAPLVRVPTNLWVASGLNVGGLFVLYLTPLYALSTRHEVVHHLLHLHFVAAGFLFAWAVAGIDPSPHRAAMRWRIVALVVTMGAHNVLAKLIYSRAGSLPPGTHSSVAETEAAAQWMYYGGHLAELALVVAVFAVWYRRRPRVSPARTAVRVASV